jgi:hypothetical protein
MNAVYRAVGALADEPPENRRKDERECGNGNRNKLCGR